MTKCFAVNVNNDIYIGRDGNLAINQNLAALMQACAHAAKAQLGEMMLAADEGVPNFETIWSDATNVAQFEAYVRRQISKVEGVIEVREFSVEIADNKAIYSATIVSIYGTEVLTNG
jgi:hypothetical protein